MWARRLAKASFSPTSVNNTLISILCSCETDRQARRAVDVEGLARLPWVGGSQFEAIHAIEELAQRDRSFQPRQRRAQAKVDAVAEGKVRVGVARDVKSLW